MSTKLGTILADFTTTLATDTAIGATSATLSSATDDDSVALPAGRYFFTLDGDNSSKEHISCDLSSTALTNIKSLSRQGVETTGVARKHRIGASVSLTDFGHIKFINDLVSGATSLNSAAPLGYDGAPASLSGNQLATVTYVLGVVNGGAVTFDQQIISNQTSGETLAVNDVVYFKESDSLWYKVDADLTATFDQLQMGICKTVAASSGVTIQVAISGPVSGFTGLTSGSKYYASNTAGGISTSAGTFSVFVGWALNTTTLLFTPFAKTLPTQKEKDAMAGGGSLGTPSNTNKFITQTYLTALPPVIRQYGGDYFGDTTTRFDVTNPAGNTFRYTYDGTGTNPGITALTFPVGYKVIIMGTDPGIWSAANLGLFTITGSGADYFEVTNASGVAEVNKTLTNGYLMNYNPTWTKPTGLVALGVKLVGSGGNGGQGVNAGPGGAGGGCGGYSEKIIPVASLGATETITIPAITGTTTFGAHVQATGGTTAVGTTPGVNGVGSLGTVNLSGATVAEVHSGYDIDIGGTGASSFLGAGGAGHTTTPSIPAQGAGGGGGGGNENGSSEGGKGKPGMVILTEYYS